MKVISCSVKTVMQPIIGVLLFIIDKAYDCFFSGDLLIGTHDKTFFVRLFESSYHRNTNEYPFRTGLSCTLSSILVII